jgi:hypothetical protein
MHYQLPTGKVVYLSIEEFLELTDDDIQYLIAHDCGDHIVNPFSGSSLKSKTSKKNVDESLLNFDEPRELSEEEIKLLKRNL